MSLLVAKWIGKTIGSAIKVPVKDGIMFPYRWSYADKLADLAKETNQVSESFLRELATQAHRKHDLGALKTIYDYMKGHDYPKSLLDKVIRYGQDIKLHESVGDPFALVESVVRHLC